MDCAEPECDTEDVGLFVGSPDEFGGTANVRVRQVGSRWRPFATAALLYVGSAGPFSGGELIGQSATEPTRIGPEARGLSKSDLAEISRQAAAEGKVVWLLAGDSSQVLPETWYIDAFLEPDSRLAGLRRGRVLRLQSVVSNGTAIRWTKRFPVAQYAQVAIAARPTSALTDKSIERPFVVTGEFSDRDLIDLVNFIRRSPEPDSKMVKAPDGTIRGEVTFPVKGGWPVTQITRKASTITVVLQDSTRSGQTVDVIQFGRGWKVLRVVLWLA